MYRIRPLPLPRPLPVRHQWFRLHPRRSHRIRHRVLTATCSGSAPAYTFHPTATPGARLGLDHKRAARRRHAHHVCASPFFALRVHPGNRRVIRAVRQLPGRRHTTVPPPSEPDGVRNPTPSRISRSKAHRARSRNSSRLFAYRSLSLVAVGILINHLQRSDTRAIAAAAA